MLWTPLAICPCVRRALPACPALGFAGLPTFVAGCSLGGCIAVNAIHRAPELFRGAVLFAPMLSLERASQHGLNYYLRWDPLQGGCALLRLGVSKQVL
jgi:alpha-beta hydrolase superfamily lysophospholipase